MRVQPPSSFPKADQLELVAAPGYNGKQLGINVVPCMRTTLDLPDEILRRAKIEAVERGSTLRQLVIDALQHEMATTERPRRRLTRPLVRLAPDAPLRSLSLEAIKELDAEEVRQADEGKGR